MTDTLAHDIARYTVAVQKSRSWIAAREEILGVAGMEPNDFRYPVKLVEARAKLAEFEAVLAGLKAPIAETARTSYVAKNAEFYRTHAERIRRNAVSNSPHPLDPKRKPIGMPNRDHATLIEAWPLVGGRWLAVAGLSYMLCRTTGDFDTATDAIAAGAETVRSAALEVLSTPDIDQAGERVAMAKKTLELCDGMKNWVDMVSQSGTGVAKEVPAEPVAGTPKPVRKLRRHATDSVTDADRAVSIVMRALRDTVRPGAPLPILRVVAAELTGAPDGAEAEVTMFDGLSARFECERYGPGPDAWKTRWSRMEGGDIELHDGAWRRVAEVVEAAPSGHAARLVSAGIVPTGENLRLYGLPAYAGQIPAPSRRYTFPVTYDHATDRCYLVDEALRTHARVVEIEAAIGEQLAVVDEDVSTFSGRHGQWHHAIDLMTDEHFAHLLDSRALTTDDLIERAVALSLSGPGPKGAKSGGVSLKNARRVLAAIGVAEPENRSRSVLADRKRMTIGRNSGGPCVNWNGGGFGWAFVHGLEDGYLRRGRTGFVEPTEALEKLQSGEKPTSTDLFEAA